MAFIDYTCVLSLGLPVVFPCWKNAPFTKSDVFWGCEKGVVWISSRYPTDVLNNHVRVCEDHCRSRIVLLLCILALQTNKQSFFFFNPQANPPCLLSTVQYISSFYANCLSGEESYWWMQFTAAVEFIKTIDDRK